MNLETFVSESLQQIIAGVRSAQRLSPASAIINPRGKTAVADDAPTELHSGLPVHQVEFDIAVTVAESHEGKAGGGLVVIGIGLAGNKSSKSETSSVSHIKFSVPIVWPDPKTLKPRS